MVTISVGSDPHRHMREVTYATEKCFMYETSTSSTWQLPSCTGAQGLFTNSVLFWFCVCVCVATACMCTHAWHWLSDIVYSTLFTGWKL